MRHKPGSQAIEARPPNSKETLLASIVSYSVIVLLELAVDIPISVPNVLTRRVPCPPQYLSGLVNGIDVLVAVKTERQSASSSRWQDGKWPR